MYKFWRWLLAQFLALIPMTAGNFDSGAATDGQVLTADGAGNAAWEAATGGGASFVYDGVAFTPGTFTADSGARTLEIELTLGGDPITSGIVSGWAHMTTDTVFDNNTNSKYWFDLFSEATCFITGTSVDAYWMLRFICAAATGHCKFTITFNNAEVAAVDVYVNVFLPSGGIATSELFSIPGVGA